MAGLVLCLGLLPFISTASSLTQREWNIDGVTRKALVHIPQNRNGPTNSFSIVFAFHGHGGSMHEAAKLYRIETLWPEAIVVYMQGLNTPGHLHDFEGKQTGWQRTVGDRKDRDLKFFDTVLADLKNDYSVDAGRVFSTGHSNGGAFTYLLWEARGKEFAGFAPSACAHVPLFGSRVERIAFLRGLGPEDKARLEKLLMSDPDKMEPASPVSDPKPVLHIAGENDPLIKFAWQKPMIDAMRKLNRCGEGATWDKDKRCTLYKSEINADVLTYVHQERHNFPKDAPEIIVKFFTGIGN